MFEQIKSVFKNEGITQIGMIDIKECEIINERILPQWAKSVIMFSIPYRSSCEFPDDGFSEYARIYDYHQYSSSLYERIIETLTYIGIYNFKGFCDHSPINEKLAAAKSGLGFIGRNSLFFDNEYGSFVFLGSLITDMECNFKAHEIKHCSNCGICADACPNSAINNFGIDRYKCLSAISQKKSKTDEEKEILKNHNIVWGCDICQNICPHNANTKISPIPYFKETRIPHITKEFVISLSDDEFQKYAFAYKGRKIVLDNIDFV